MVKRGWMYIFIGIESMWVWVNIKDRLIDILWCNLKGCSQFNEFMSKYEYLGVTVSYSCCSRFIFIQPIIPSRVKPPSQPVHMHYVSMLASNNRFCVTCTRWLDIQVYLWDLPNDQMCDCKERNVIKSICLGGTLFQAKIKKKFKLK